MNANDRFKFRVYDKKEEKYIWDVIMECNGIVGKINDEEFIKEQCTGRKDINGKLVYENDRIRDSLTDVEYFIAFNDILGIPCLYRKHKDHENSMPLHELKDLYNFEIVGTIHDKKE